MALYGWRRPLQPHHLQHASVALHLCGDILSHLVSHLLIVGANDGRKLLRIGLSVEHHHWDAFVIGTVYGRGHDSGLIGGYYQQVDAGSHQRVDLFYLPFVTVVGTGKAELYILINIVAHAQLCIQLVAPDVL